jgi:hypothetical protein
MKPDVERQIAMARVKSLVTLASQRGLNPPIDLETDLTVFSLSDLEILRRALHELVYAPPIDNR